METEGFFNFIKFARLDMFLNIEALKYFRINYGDQRVFQF